MKGKFGFTLIELIIVIVIIGILAAIAAPMMSGNVNKAKKSEAVSVLGAIRTAERLYYVDHNEYTDVTSWGAADGELNAYITDNEIRGRYFTAGCYSVTGADANNFTATCDPSLSTDPDGNRVTGNVTMYANGLIEGYN